MRLVRIESGEFRATALRCDCPYPYLSIVDYVYGGWWVCRACRSWYRAW
jgi:hypothetical protein